MNGIEKRIDKILMQDRKNIFALYNRQSVIEDIIKVVRQDFARELLKELKGFTYTKGVFGIGNPSLNIMDWDRVQLVVKKLSGLDGGDK